MYDIKIMGPLPYFRHQLKRHGLKRLLSLTDSGYPRILALGVCYHSTKEIVICKALNWKLRLLHELGHEYGLKHVRAKGRVMHPWGFLRGGLIDRAECDSYTASKIKKRFQEVLKNG